MNPEWLEPLVWALDYLNKYAVSSQNNGGVNQELRTSEINSLVIADNRSRNRNTPEVSISGNKIVDDVFGTLLTIRMLIGGVIAFTLDNITGGATRKQRGFVSDCDVDDEISVERNGYALPSWLNNFFLRYSWLTYLPVIPSERELSRIEDKRKKFSFEEKA